MYRGIRSSEMHVMLTFNDLIRKQSTEVTILICRNAQYNMRRELWILWGLVVYLELWLSATHSYHFLGRVRRLAFVFSSRTPFFCTPSLVFRSSDQLFRAFIPPLLHFRSLFLFIYLERLMTFICNGTVLQPRALVKCWKSDSFKENIAYDRAQSPALQNKLNEKAHFYATLS